MSLDGWGLGVIHLSAGVTGPPASHLPEGQPMLVQVELARVQKGQWKHAGPLESRLGTGMRLFLAHSVGQSKSQSQSRFKVWRTTPYLLEE